MQRNKELILNHRATFYEKYIKRLLDIIISACGLIILSPVLLITALLVRIKLGSPVIFMQPRPGKGEKIFKLHKFRSMNNARGADGQLLPDAQRLAPFGKKLRALSLDELPELFDILRGKMSLVGPRPLLCEYLPYYNERERLRHAVRPGLTGLAQVNGRNNLTWEEKFAFDIQYVSDGLSLKQDLKIVIMTVSKVLHREDVQVDTQFSEGNLAELRSNDKGKRVSL